MPTLEEQVEHFPFGGCCGKCRLRQERHERLINLLIDLACNCGAEGPGHFGWCKTWWFRKILQEE